MKVKKVFETLALFCVFGLASCTTEQKMIDNPKKGDVYQLEYHNINGHKLAYKLVKVEAVKGNEVLLMPNRVYYDEKVYCLSEGDYFSIEDSYHATKAGIKEWYKNGMIIEMFRLYEASCLGNDK